MKFRMILMLIISLVMVSCKEEQPKVLDITGQWELADIVDTKSVQIGSETVEIYIDFKADNTFELWIRSYVKRNKNYKKNEKNS